MAASQIAGSVIGNKRFCERIQNESWRYHYGSQSNTVENDRCSRLLWIVTDDARITFENYRTWGKSLPYRTIITKNDGNGRRTFFTLAGR